MHCPSCQTSFSLSTLCLDPGASGIKAIMNTSTRNTVECRCRCTYLAHADRATASMVLGHTVCGRHTLGVTMIRHRRSRCRSLDIELSFRAPKVLAQRTSKVVPLHTTSISLADTGALHVQVLPGGKVSNIKQSAFWQYRILCHTEFAHDALW